MLHPQAWKRVDVNKIHPDLIRVANHALSILAAKTPSLTFIITDGDRTREQQIRLKTAGASRTLNSRHIAKNQPSGKAEAIDVAALLDGQVRWDWPLYSMIAKAMQQAAASESVKIEWGGNWRKFRDGPHFQLSR